MIQIDYVRQITQQPERLNREIFEGMIRSGQVRRCVEGFRQAPSGEEADALKRQMPGVCWQATYGGGKRTDANAVPNGLFALDIDHIAAMGLVDCAGPDDLWKRIRDRIDELDIVCVHKTISGDGLRIVALCQPQFRSIAENQAWLAGAIGCGYDVVCRDWARVSFVSVEEDFFYVDWETMF